MRIWRLLVVGFGILLIACGGPAAPGTTQTDGDTEAVPEDERGEAEAEHVQDSRLEAWRPQFHYSPQKGWMNDPNGLVYSNGEYHLFYQYAPESFVLSGLHWGHAISLDLVHWQDLGVAIYPDPLLGNAYSGSAVVDSTNSSGLCTGDSAASGHCLIALFTHSGGDDGTQKQSLAYSVDGGRNFRSLYAANPVLRPEAGQKDFRDPKVFRHAPSGAWIMALTLGNAIRFYRSPDLKAWTALSTLRKDAADPTGTWECPELFAITPEGETQEKWVLIISVQSGGAQGGSSVRYLVGDFDGTTFRPEVGASEPLWLDRGADFYAFQSWSNGPAGRRIGLAWMNSWSYALGLKTTPWQGQMSLPRDLRLVRSGTTWLLQARLAPEAETLRGETLLDENEERPLDGERELPEARGLASYELRLSLSPSANGEVGMHIGDTQQPALTLRYASATATLALIRNDLGLLKMPASFSGRHEAPLALSAGRLELRLLVDRSSLEIVTTDGTVLMSELFFPNTDALRLTLFSHGAAATTHRLRLSRLSSVW